MGQIPSTTFAHRQPQVVQPPSPPTEEERTPEARSESEDEADTSGTIPIITPSANAEIRETPSDVVPENVPREPTQPQEEN
jgi:hypothetical protein